MRLRRFVLALSLAGAFATAACVGTTGGGIVTFRAAAAGPDGIAPGVTFDTTAGYRVRLDRAQIYVGSLYLNMAQPQAAGRETSCVLPGIYVAQVTEGGVVDALSSKLQFLPGAGEATADRAVTGEVWFGQGDINAPTDRTIILDAAGVAERNGQTFPFSARFTIGQNRVVPPQNPALPGSNPLCQERIVTPIPVSLTPAQGGALLLKVDPRPWFANVSFVELTPDATGTYVFLDANEGQPSRSLYEGIHLARGVYSFDWIVDPG